MGIIQKLATFGGGTQGRYERGANYELGSSINSSGVANIFGTGGNNINVLQEYSGYVWKCINSRSETLADQNIFVERKVGDKWQPDPNHEFERVLHGEDGQYDLYEMIEGHQICMDMYGESFWYFSKGETYGKPMGRFLLDPAYVSVFISNDQVAGYVYQKNGNRITMDLDEVAHYRIHDPRRPFRGVGPMQSAAWFIRSSRYVTTYVNNFLENNAIPAGVIVANGDVDDNDWNLFKEQWATRYSGVDNAGKTGFVRGSDINFVKTGLSLGDVDFEKIKNSSRDDILAMFGVPKPIIGIYTDINRASAVTVRQMFAISFTSPSLKRISRKLSTKVSKWYGPEYRIGITNPIPDDREVRLKEYDALLGRAITVNEARAAFDLAPLPGGDVINPVAATGNNGPPQPPVAPKSVGKVTITKSNKAKYDYQMKESFRSQMESVQIKYETHFLKKAHPVLDAQKKHVLNQIKPKKLSDAELDTEVESTKLSDATLPLFIGLAEEQGALAAAFAGSSDTTFTLTPFIEKYIADSVIKAAQSFTEETQTRLASALADGIANGDSIGDIGKSISAIYDDVLGISEPGYRIERLARTEVIKTSNEITETAYKQSGVVQKKEWLANPGACEFCRSLNGSILTLGSTFVPKGSSIDGADGGSRINDYEDVNHPPIHSNCRCTLIPVIED
jgi:HK97 family phage portal protein